MVAPWRGFSGATTQNKKLNISIEPPWVLPEKIRAPQTNPCYSVPCRVDGCNRESLHLQSRQARANLHTARCFVLARTDG